MTDVALHVSRGADLDGVRRFYTGVMGVPEADCTLVADCVEIKVYGACTDGVASHPRHF